MKTKLLVIFMALMTAIGASNLRILVVTPTPAMHCESCENKIKSNMRFEKGVKKVETSLERQEVSITYDAKKNDVEGLRAAMKKIGYDTKVVSDKEVKSNKKSKK
ncbi:MAG: heavy-metal-associated domain-containing protein [Bacteroidales bacterium]|nr:heavy-metal-associated domain-containing protein [Bacteroidales bacterium]